MKRMRIVVSVVLLTAMISVAANASYVYEPTPKDLYDLDHYHFYVCKIDSISIPANEQIQSASLSIEHIDNYADADNHLYIHLLSGNDFEGVNFNANGIYAGYDNKHGGDNINAYDGIVLDTYIDAHGGGQPENYVYNFSNSDR